MEEVDNEEEKKKEEEDVEEEDDEEEVSALWIYVGGVMLFGVEDIMY